MKEYYLNDLIEYIDCPLKYRLKKEIGLEGSCDLSSNSIISSALAETYLRACHLYAQGRPMTVQERAKHFSKVWNSLKDKFVSNGGSENRAHAQLIASHKKVIDMTRLVPEGWDISLVDFATERVLGGALVHDSIDLALVNSKNTKIIELIFLDRSLEKDMSTDFRTILRALFNYHYFKSELAGVPDLKIRCISLNLHHGKRKPIQFTPDIVNRYRYVTADIISSIESKLYYPRPGALACKHCLFTKECYFSQA